MSAEVIFHNVGRVTVKQSSNARGTIFCLTLSVTDVNGTEIGEVVLFTKEPLTLIEETK